MIHIKRFVDKITLVESKRKDVILPIDEAKGLRDEIVKLLSDLHEVNSKKDKEEIIKVEITGGKFK